ncbi:MAG: hypothetical protein EOP83_22415 [Verrucomicrobiaceae bacterium]|nr:MAG: hypothetical protein EOP83_22415 [Verrucomicrobiaceae bacterium]
MKNPTKTPITRESLLATASYNNRWFAGILASTTVLGTSALHAVTWDGSDSTAWNTATNWVGDVVPNGAVATISSTAPNIATITAPLSSTPTGIEVGRAGLAGRLDHVSGAAANAANQSLTIGGGGAGSSGIYNLAKAGS